MSGTGLDLNRLKQYRNEILKAEIGALLFNLGKTHIGFWEEKENVVYFNIDKQSFKQIYGFEVFKYYRDYYKNQQSIRKSPFDYELDKYKLEVFINRKVNFPFIIVNNSYDIEWKEFFKGDSSTIDFIKRIFFRGCENINSGIDKGAPKTQTKPPLWLSNAFGSFKKPIEEKDFDQRRQRFFQNLHDFLNQNGYLQNPNPNWEKIRNFILDEVKKWYENLLSDTRFPINDVSLWDQAYMTASMFKAVLSQLIMDTNLDDIRNHKYKYFNNPSSIRWRILGIQYDKLGLAEKGFKLASIRWYREVTNEIDNKIKELLEVEYPIGNEIYRDETGIYFVVGEDIGKDNGEFAELNKDLEDIECKIIQIFEDEGLGGEVYPTIVLTKASRGLMTLGYLLDKAKENFLKNKTIRVKSLNLVDPKKGKTIGICPLCKVRLIYEEDKNRNNSPTICEVCDDRIHHKQVERWIESIKSETKQKKALETIWTTEIKDKNDRIALISLKFELHDWLNGNMLNTLSLRYMDYKDFEDFKEKIKSFIILLLSDIPINFDTKVIDEKIQEINSKIQELDKKDKECKRPN